MIVTSHLATLLTTRKIVLWVEDALTKEYLLRLWQPEDIHFNILVGGGSSTIRAVVHDLRADGNGHVFGLTDLDFSQTNQHQWNNLNSGLEVFRLPVLEVENYLLDWAALEGCAENTSRHNLGRAMIESTAQARAQQMVWWMTCRSVLANYRDLLCGGFPEHPKIPSVQSLSDAETYIKTTSNWLPGVLANAQHITDPSLISADLQTAFASWDAALKDGTWPRCYSGREIYRVLRGRILDAGGGTATDKDIDLAKSVADWQRTNLAVPTDLSTLLSAIKQRVGI